MSSAWMRAIVIAAAVCAGACSTQKRVLVAEVPADYAGPKLRRVVVLAENTTPEMRHNLEDRFATELSYHGVEAVPSYQALGEQLPPPSDSVRVGLAQQGFDGALVVHVGRGQSVFFEDKTSKSKAQDAAPIVTETTVTSHAAMWNLNSAKAIWSARSETTNATSGDVVASGIVPTMVTELANKGVVPKNRNR